MPQHQQQLWRRLMDQRHQSADKNFVGTEKLLLTCRDKENYVVHAKILQFYLCTGLQLRRVHCLLSFRQAAILEPEHSTQQRATG
jgi:hypothetical protein